MSGVTLVTPGADVSGWTHNTLEQGYIENHLVDLGVSIIEKHQLQQLQGGEVIIEHVVSGVTRSIQSDQLIMVTARRPLDNLFHALDSDQDGLANAGVISIERVGDCLAPSTIAAAIHHGHLYAREFGRNIDIDQVPYEREYAEI